MRSRKAGVTPACATRTQFSPFGFSRSHELSHEQVSERTSIRSNSDRALRSIKRSRRLPIIATGAWDKQPQQVPGNAAPTRVSSAMDWRSKPAAATSYGHHHHVPLPHHSHSHHSFRQSSGPDVLRLQDQERRYRRAAQLDSRFAAGVAAVDDCDSSERDVKFLGSSGGSATTRSRDLAMDDDVDDDDAPPPPSLLNRSSSLSGVFFTDRFSSDPGATIVAAAATVSATYPHHLPSNMSSSHSGQGYTIATTSQLLQQQQLQPSLLSEPSPFRFASASASTSVDALPSTNNALSSLQSFDLQHFDETAGLDLQQLFPTSSSSSSVSAATVRDTSVAMAIDSDIQQQQQQSQQQFAYSSVGGYYPNAPAAAASPEYFVEGFQNYHADAVPFSQFAVAQPPLLQPSLCASAFATTAQLRGTNSSSDDDDGSSSGVPSVAAAKSSPDRRKLCCVEGCKSQARAFNRCKRHGGSKRCSSPGCTKSVQSRGLCIRHGGGTRCQESGCARAAQSHGKCKVHGGGRLCVVAGCEKKAHLKRLCRKHGGGTKCSVADCDKWAQRQGMCMTHSKQIVAGGNNGDGSNNSNSGADTGERDAEPAAHSFLHHAPPVLQSLQP